MINSIENIDNEFILHDMWRIVIQDEHSDWKGRLLTLNAKIKDKNCFLKNPYGSNKDAEAVRFHQDLYLSITLRGFDLDSDCNVYVILGGDFVP